MRVFRTFVLAAALAAFALPGASPRSLAQEPPGPVSVSAGYATGADEWRRWDALLDTMVRAGNLVTMSRRNDRAVGGRVHEYLAQYVDGVPVQGAGVSRQLDAGVTVSLFGTVHEGIDIDTSPALTAEEAVALLEQETGATLAAGRPPALVILPTSIGAHWLAYRLTMSNVRTYFVDATSGRIVHEVDERRTQAAIGGGAGILGDRKKVSASLVDSGFQAHDRIRPAEILTLDAHMDPFRFIGLISPGPPGVQRWTGSDLAADADNEWEDSAVVDAHAVAGFTYDYFAQQHGFNGIDGENGRFFTVVNIGPLPTALWAGAPFGPEGTGIAAFGQLPSGTAIVAEDVVAHELMHGVTHNSVLKRTGVPFGFGLPPFETGPTRFELDGRVYTCGNAFGVSRRSRRDRLEFPLLCRDGAFVVVSNHGGALHESYSDIFAAAVEFFLHEPGTGPLRADYLVGEDVPEFGVLAAGAPGPIRSLENPGSIPILPPRFISPPVEIGMPDAYRGAIRFFLLDNRPEWIEPTLVAWVSGSAFALPTDDRGAEHWNSTVLSHAFYLAIEGGMNRTTGIVVEGAGNREQVERAFFRAMTDMMPPDADFFVAARVIHQSAVDLFGPDAGVTEAIRAALVAVDLLPPAG